MFRGWGIRVACGLAAIVAGLSLAESASAGKKTEHVLQWGVFARADNGYRFELQGIKMEQGGPAVLASFRSQGSTATYIVRHPERLTRRRLKADFGELGEVDLKYRGKIRHQGSRNRCQRLSVGFGRFKGGLHLEGEDGFARVKSGQVGGVVFNFRGRKRCQGRRSDFPIPLQGEQDRSRLLVTCGPESGTGFAAFEFEPGSEGGFLASKTSVVDDVRIIRTLSLTGATRRLAVSPDDGRAKVRPPAPFEGRGEYVDGEMTGNLRAPLPGAGLVRLTPSEGTLTSFSDAKDLPKCFPSVFSAFAPGGSWVTGIAVGATFREIALTSATRRALAALGR